MFVTVPGIARVHHEFVLFTIDVEEKGAQTVEDFVTSEEKNDSKGIVWVPLGRGQPYKSTSSTRD